MGFEVHNTTSQLNVQGAVCAYRMMANDLIPSTYTATIGTDGAWFSGINIRHPPLNTAEALLLSGTRQWEAKDGIYSVTAFINEENPALPIPMTTPVINVPGNDDLDGVFNLSAVFTPYPAPPFTVGGLTSVYPMIAFRVHPIHQSGAIFTGLSDTTTLTLNWNVYYESFPSQVQLQILPLATPSCEFDPDALDFYSRIMVDLPVGVQVRENGLGDWFLDAASKAASFIGPAIAALPHPIAKGAGAALSYLGETGGNYVKRNQQAPPPNTWEESSGFDDWNTPQQRNPRVQIQNAKPRKKKKAKQPKKSLPPPAKKR
jgi:hypothetical protein